MRRFISTLLIVAILSLTGCGNGTKPSLAESASSSIESSISQPASSITENPTEIPSPEPSSSPSPAISPSPSPSPTPTMSDDEEENLLILLRANIVSTLTGMDGFELDHDTEKDTLLVRFWMSGIGDLAAAAAAGNPDALLEWQNVSENMVILNDSFCGVAALLDLAHYSITCEYLSGIDKQLLISACDGEIIYDIVPSSVAAEVAASSEYAFEPIDVRYQAAYDEFKSYTDTLPTAMNTSRLFFPSNTNDCPSFSINVNFFSAEESVYNFQTLVCGILETLQSISEKYFVEYSGVSINYLFGEYIVDGQDHVYDRISYDVRYNSTDLFSGTLEDTYNDASAYNISPYNINAWYSGEDFTSQVQESNAPCTYEEYLMLEDGMSYQDVVTLIGSEGSELSSVTVAGNTASVYEWEGSRKYSSVVVEFLNDELCAKSQYGLD